MNVVPLFEYHNRWKSLTQADFSSAPQTTWSDDFKGFILNANVKPADVSGYGQATNGVATVPHNNSLWLRMMVEYCQERNVTPILMSTPSPVNWNMARHNGIQELANELGIAYVDLNLIHTELGIDWNSDSYDGGDHLNIAGARKVSRYVGNYLSKTYKLGDHRGDAAYDAWNASYERYAKHLQEA